MRVCVSCGASYGSHEEACPVDGAALEAWSGSSNAPTLVLPEDAEPNAVGTPPKEWPRDSNAPTLVLPEDVERDKTSCSKRISLDGISAEQTLVDRYELKRPIGAGGFGVVYEAEDLRLHKRVAVKLLSPEAAQVGENVARFQQEAIAASQVGHDGIVDVTDFGVDRFGTWFIVMEMLDGRSLTSLLAEEGPIPATRALAIAVQIANALAAAHEKGILHRDLKPSNILLVNRDGHSDVVKILDFGISKMLHAEIGAEIKTSAGLIMGTPYYMAPEYASGREIDGRVDVFALGVILYEMLTKERPFGSGSLQTLFIQMETRPPPRPSARMPESKWAHDVDVLVQKALARNPEDRYQSMGTFAAALHATLFRMDSIRAHLVKPPTGPMPIEVASEPRPARRLGVLGIAIAVLLVVAGVGFVLLRPQPDAVGPRPQEAALPPMERGPVATPLPSPAAQVSPPAAATVETPPSQNDAVELESPADRPPEMRPTTARARSKAPSLPKPSRKSKASALDDEIYTNW